MEGGLREDIPTVKLARSECEQDGRIWLPKLMKLLDLCPSTSEGRRLIQGGGVSVNQQKISDPTVKISPEDGMIIAVGKRRVAKVQMA